MWIDGYAGNDTFETGLGNDKIDEVQEQIC